MELGSSTARFWGVEKDFLKVLDWISEYFKVAELWVEPPHYPSWRTSREKADLDRLTDILVVTELKTTIHAPCRDLSLCSWNPAVNVLAVKEITKSLEMAAEINSKVVTFHPGKWRLSAEDAGDILRRNLEVLDDVAADYSAKLCLENPHHDGCCRTIGDMLEVTGGLKNIYLTLDLAHLSLEKNQDLGEHKSKLARKVRNVHIANITDEARHTPLLKETRFLRESLKALKGMKYKGPVILEGKIEESPERIIPREVATFRKMLRRACPAAP